MAKKKTAAKSSEMDAKEFFAAIADIEKEKGIPKPYMLEKITQALVAAYKRDHEGISDNVVVDANEERGEVRMFIKKDVVETVDNPYTEMSLHDARMALPRAQLGDVVRIEIKPKNFGRIAAQTARQVIIQGMREAERGMVFAEFSAKEHEILTGTVSRVDPRSGSVSIRLSSGSEVADAFLSAGEQVKGETVQEGDRVKVYVVEVRSTTRGPQVLISRTHPGLVKRLFELEVPEIYDGTVQVMSIAREAGSRTKLAVWSDDPNVDPIGACVGPKGQRVNAIVEELRGEKVDIIKYSEKPDEYVAAALAPANVLSVVELEAGKSCRVIVPDDQLSLAIGKEGQNARLAARLTGYKIDIRPASDPLLPEPPKKKFKCVVCGYIHEADELPPDFICPICQEPGGLFLELVEPPQAPEPPAPPEAGEAEDTAPADVGAEDTPVEAGEAESTPAETEETENPPAETEEVIQTDSAEDGQPAEDEEL